MKFAWGLMTFFAVGIGGYGLMVLSGVVANEFLERFDDVRLAANLHFGGGGLALLLGPWQFSRRLRKKYLSAHRWMGRAYLLAVVGSGSAGIFLAPRAHGGLVSATGFGLLGVLWVATALLAFWTIRRGDVSGHQRWMMRNFALTYAAVMLRVYLPAAGALGVEFDRAYPVIAWACWVPNLLLVDWLLLAPRRR